LRRFINPFRLYLSKALQDQRRLDFGDGHLAEIRFGQIQKPSVLGLRRLGMPFLSSFFQKSVGHLSVSVFRTSLAHLPFGSLSSSRISFFGQQGLCAFAGIPRLG
jgi:hypothetical protein